ncbi:MAG: response regulator transcription factor [Acidimicrobiales bacterium]
MASTVLVIEDELQLRELVRAYLRREGIDVLSTGSGAEGLALAVRGEPDLVILDLGLPDVAGEEVARELRRTGDVPILVLTAKVAEADRIHCFELGADDYLTKPFSPRELVLRSQAILRRGRRGAPDDLPLSFGGGELRLDEQRREVHVRGKPVVLTPTEWGLLAALTGSPGRVYSRQELVNRVRGYEHEGYERTVDSHVRNLRRKLEADPRAPRIVLTVLGGGYRFGLARDS